MDKATFRLKFNKCKGNEDSNEYKFEAIYDSAVYARETEDHLSGVNYLVL